MSLAGQGAVAIWHDIAPEGRAAFYAWHGQEHMPERAGIPGFVRGRRYVAVAAEPEFFNLYETVSPRTVIGPEYLSRLNAPTRWTSDTVRHFRAVSRSLCAVAGSFGEGQGGLIATFRYDVAHATRDAHRARMTQQILPALAAAPDVAGCHLLVADEAASALETAEKRVRAEKNLIPRWIVLVEGWGDETQFRAICQGLRDDAMFADALQPPMTGIYRLQNSRAQFPWGAA